MCPIEIVPGVQAQRHTELVPESCFVSTRNSPYRSFNAPATVAFYTQIRMRIHNTRSRICFVKYTWLRVSSSITIIGHARRSKTKSHWGVAHATVESSIVCENFASSTQPSRSRMEHTATRFSNLICVVVCRWWDDNWQTQETFETGRFRRQSRYT